MWHKLLARDRKGTAASERMLGEKMFTCLAVSNRLVGNSKWVTVLSRFPRSLLGRQRERERERWWWDRPNQSGLLQTAEEDHSGSFTLVWPHRVQRVVLPFLPAVVATTQHEKWDLATVSWDVPPYSYLVDGMCKRAVRRCFDVVGVWLCYTPMP